MLNIKQMFKINFSRQLTVTEEKILGIMSAKLPGARIGVREYSNYAELLINGILYTVDKPNKSQSQYIISQGFKIEARSTSLFRAVMLIAHSLSY